MKNPIKNVMIALLAIVVSSSSWAGSKQDAAAVQKQIQTELKMLGMMSKALKEARQEGNQAAVYFSENFALAAGLLTGAGTLLKAEMNGRGIGGTLAKKIDAIQVKGEWIPTKPAAGLKIVGSTVARCSGYGIVAVNLFFAGIEGLKASGDGFIALYDHSTVALLEAKIQIAEHNLRLAETAIAEASTN